MTYGTIVCVYVIFTELGHLWWPCECPGVLTVNEKPVGVNDVRDWYRKAARLAV